MPGGMLTTRRRVEWPKSPRRTMHEALGRRITFRARNAPFAVERFPEASGLWLLVRLAAPPRVLSTHRRRTAAQRAAERFARAEALA